MSTAVERNPNTTKKVTAERISEALKKALGGDKFFVSVHWIDGDQMYSQFDSYGFPHNDFNRVVLKLAEFIVNEQSAPPLLDSLPLADIAVFDDQEQGE